MATVGGGVGAAIDPISVACEMERRGIAIYRRAIRIASDDRQRALLQRLLGEEESHFDYFELLRGNSAIINQSDDVSSALASAIAAEAYMPGGLMQMAEAFTSMDRLLEAAVQAEKDSITYYERMQDAYADLCEQLSEIISQERAHLAELLSWRSGAGNKDS
ncbi:hypothetical protein FACS1894184_00540 [Clostridia bacterium]|nr:hypothetical protein FACS1894184_00540 [Clostridia bacterium]